MSYVTPDPDVVATALADLLGQFAESPGVTALVSLLVRSWQSLEDDGATLVFDALLSNATGALLDRYGLIVGVPRDGRSDDAYRALLQVTISARDTSGTIDSITSVIAQLAGGAVKYSPWPLAAYQLEIDVAAPLSAESIADIIAQLFKLSPAGVSFMASQVPPDPFAFDGPDGLGFDAGSFAGSIYVS
jgi:hypothetical protein